MDRSAPAAGRHILRSGLQLSLGDQRRMRTNLHLCALSLLRTSAAHLSKGEDFDAGLARQRPDLVVDELRLHRRAACGAPRRLARARHHSRPQ
jgi:hypothetical protein